MDDAPQDNEMGLLVSFPDQSESFALGFEAGQIWQEMDGKGKLVIDRGYDEGIPVHSDNITVIQNMARVRGYEIKTKRTGLGEWTGVQLTYVGTGKAKPRLSVVPHGDAPVSGPLADSDGDDGA